jgi:hypothetical protein
MAGYDIHNLIVIILSEIVYEIPQFSMQSQNIPNKFGIAMIVSLPCLEFRTQSLRFIKDFAIRT